MERAHTLSLGGVSITTVWDGTLDARLETILRLDPAEAERRITMARKATGVDPLVLPVRAFIVQAAGRVALIDTGSGTTKGASMGHLPASLAAIGIGPEAIDTVLLTHLHMDHAGGLVGEDGGPAFPNAELVLHQKEAEHFLDMPVERLDPRSARHVEFQRAAAAAYGSRVRRIGDGVALPGVVARLTPGHTPGHTSWFIEGSDGAAVVLGDVVHMSAIQLPLPLTPMIYDVDPDLAGATRVALLDEVAGRGLLVAGAHLPSTGLGRIEREGEGYRFTPADTGVNLSP